MNPELAKSILSNMEDDVLAVARWAGVLDLLGTSPHAIQPEQLYVVARAIKDLGDTIVHDWNEALNALGRQQ